VTGPDVAPGLIDARVVGLLDPVVETLRGALPYADRPAELADPDAVPTLRVRRRTTAPGLTVAIDRHVGVDRVHGDDLAVDRLPVDRDLATIARRPYPAATSVLRLLPPEAPPGAGADARFGSHEVVDLTVAEHGPGREDVRAIVTEARRHRLVALDRPLPGDPVLTAALVLQLTAAGVACWCSRDVAGRLDLLAPALREAVAADPASALDDDLAAMARAARQRRAAWWHHDLRLTWSPDDAGAWTPRLAPALRPTVSVVLVSRRPALVPSALAMLAEQRGVTPEVVVAVHGDAGDTAVDAERRRLGLAGAVLHAPATVPFGTVLNLAVERTSGRTVVKWDDDDLYGPDHLVDLLVAHRQTGAGLVGKASEFTYLEEEDETLWRVPRRAESRYLWIAGGTFCLSRDLLDDVGGFPDLPRAVDHHLKLAIDARGETVFRTHGFGFALRRHGRGHTWETTADYLREKTVRSFAGLPEVLGLEDAARFAELPHVD
jgi:hypothetical protein